MAYVISHWSILICHLWLALPNLLFLSRRRLRCRQWLTWQLFITVRCKVHERSHDDRIFHHIRALNAFVHIHVGMMRPAVVFHRVLYELEAGQTHGVERKMIGAAGVANA